MVMFLQLYDGRFKVNIMEPAACILLCTCAAVLHPLLLRLEVYIWAKGRFMHKVQITRGIGKVINIVAVREARGFAYENREWKCAYLICCLGGGCCYLSGGWTGRSGVFSGSSWRLFFLGRGKNCCRVKRAGVEWPDVIKLQVCILLETGSCILERRINFISSNSGVSVWR